MKLRGGTAELKIETSRWCGSSRDEQIGKTCKIVTKKKCIMWSSSYCTVASYRLGGGEKGMERLMKETVGGWQEMEGKEKVVWVVDKACESRGVAS